MKENQRPLILVGLNEVNFDYIQAYARKGLLPNFQALFDRTSLIRTVSEKSYHELEPWIQWVSIQTGKNFSEHGVFRLGDMTNARHEQIWEHLERSYGVTVGAVSPMNAANRAKKPAFFIPDPWTRTETTGNWLLRRLAASLGDAVNENASGTRNPVVYLDILLGLLWYSFRRQGPAAIVQAFHALRCHYRRPFLLDRILTDLFCAEWLRARPGFSSLFLNAAAHTQHHYLFNSACYDGPNKNPDWYIDEGRDPVLEAYQCYDRVLKDLLNLPGNPRLIIATGLHQNPVQAPVYYWRLADHADFLSRLGIVSKGVQPRMSRDFLIEFEDRAQTEKAAATLAGCVSADNGERIFLEIENRGQTLFVTLTWSHDVGGNFSVAFTGGRIENFRQHIAFVALKNGEHDGEGYLIDTENAIPAGAAFPVTDIFSLIDGHFSGTSTKAADRKIAAGR